MSKTTMTIKVVVEKEVEVEYTYHRATRGARSSLGVPEEPDDPEEVEVEEVRDLAGNTIPECDLSETDFDEISERILHQMKERSE